MLGLQFSGKRYIGKYFNNYWQEENWYGDKSTPHRENHLIQNSFFPFEWGKGVQSRGLGLTDIHTSYYFYININ